MPKPVKPAEPAYPSEHADFADLLRYVTLTLPSRLPAKVRTPKADMLAAYNALAAAIMDALRPLPLPERYKYAAHMLDMGTRDCVRPIPNKRTRELLVTLATDLLFAIIAEHKENR